MRMYGDWSDSEQPFAGIHGAGVRLVNDLADSTRSWAVVSHGTVRTPVLAVVPGPRGLMVRGTPPATGNGLGQDRQGEAAGAGRSTRPMSVAVAPDQRVRIVARHANTSPSIPPRPAVPALEGLCAPGRARYPVLRPGWRGACQSRRGGPPSSRKAGSRISRASMTRSRPIRSSCWRTSRSITWPSFHWPGIVTVGTRIARFGRSSVHWDQAVFHRGACTAHARSVMVLADRTREASVRIPDDLRVQLTERGAGPRPPS